MEERILDLDENIVQRSIKELPIGVKAILSKIYDDIREGISQGKVPLDNWDSDFDRINLIPSKYRGYCCPVLVGVCYDKDNFETRMRECLDHASITCKGINHEIYFFTTQWNSNIANNYRGYIDSLKQNGILIHMIYVTNAGIALMPI